MAVADGSPEDSGGGSPGVWGSWGPWSACSRSCSGGVMEQTRPCLPSSYRGRGGSRPSGPTLPFAGHVVSAVRTSVPLHRSREEQRALVGSDASRPGPTVVRGSRHPQSRGREPSERRYVRVPWTPCLSLPWTTMEPLPSFCRVGGILAFTPYVHKCACGGRPVETTEQHLVWLFRPSLPFGFLGGKKKSLTWQKLTALVRLTNQEPPGFHLSPPPQLCLALLPNPLSVFLGMEVRSSSCRQLLYSPRHFPSPHLASDLFLQPLL